MAAVAKCKPIPGSCRHVVKVVNPELHKANLFRWLKKQQNPVVVTTMAGITTRHIGGGHKQAYRIVDFKRNKRRYPGSC